MKHEFSSGGKSVSFKIKLIRDSFGDYYGYEIQSSSDKEAVGKSDAGYSTLDSAVKAALIAVGLLGASLLLLALGVIYDLYSWC